MEIHNKLFYDGQWQTAKSEEYFDVINPSNEQVIAKVIDANKEDVDLAVQSARKAFDAWNTTSPEDRANYLRKVLDILIERQDEIAEVVTKELGASIKFSKAAHVPSSIREMTSTLEEFKNFKFEEEIDNVSIIKEGAGVVACVTPWNYPLNQIQRKVTPSLLAGNTVVVKPASYTPLTAILFSEIFEEAGLPAGVFNMVTGSGSKTGEYLTAHPDVDVISFTGSTDVGKHLYENASTTVKNIILELGGKSALVYLKDGDLDLAIKQAADSVLDNQGQTCAAFTRLLVPKAELETVKSKLKDYYKDIVVGNPSKDDTRVGPLVSSKQLDRVLNYIEIGKKEGAELLLGGNKLDRTGYYVEPTIFVNVTNDMQIAQEEIFGPVLSVITYDTIEEAIEIANDSIYGLSGAVVGPKEEALEVARRMKTGNIYVNGGARSPKAPFGGYKQSGIGRENGLYGIEEAVEIKAIFK